MMLTIEKVLSDEDGARQMDELRTFLAAHGWDVLAEEGDVREESKAARVLAESATPPARFCRCPHCNGVGRGAGVGTCGLCGGTGEVESGTRHPGRCCE